MSGGYLNTAPPGPTIALGSLVTGQPVALTIEGFNTGDESLVITSVASSDPQLAIGAGWSLPMTVAPEHTTGVNLQLTLTPSGTGAGSATLTINTDAINSPVTVTWTWIGAASVHNIIATPQGTLFPNTKIGNQSAEILFTVQNVGNVNCTISAYTFPTDYVAGPTGPALPQTLAPKATYQFGVKFAPTAQGLLTENVQITSDATSSPTLLNVQGVGYAINPAFVIGPGPLSLAIAFNTPQSGPNTPSIKTPSFPGIPFSWKCEEDAFVGTWKLLPFPTDQGMVEGYSYEKRITRILFHYEDHGHCAVFVTVTTMRGDTATQQVNIGSPSPVTPPLVMLAFADFDLTDEVAFVKFATEGATSGGNNGVFVLADYVVRYVPKGESKAK